MDAPNLELIEPISAAERAARASLYKKLALVMGDMTRLAKTGFNNFHKYKFASEADVADAVRTSMATHNLALLPQIVKMERVDTGRKTSGGSITFCTVVQIEFTFADGDSGATESRMWYGEANDSDDKGINKAVTAAEKYFLLKTFLISSGDVVDDPDHGENEGVTGKKKTEFKKLTPPPAENGKVVSMNGAALPVNGKGEPLPSDTTKRVMKDKPAAESPAEAEQPTATWDTPNILDLLLKKCNKELAPYTPELQPSDIMRLIGRPDKDYKVLAYWIEWYPTPKAAYEAIEDAVKFDALA